MFFYKASIDENSHSSRVNQSSKDLEMSVVSQETRKVLQALRTLMVDNGVIAHIGKRIGASERSL